MHRYNNNWKTNNYFGFVIPIVGYFEFSRAKENRIRPKRYHMNIFQNNNLNSTECLNKILILIFRKYVINFSFN